MSRCPLVPITEAEYDVDIQIAYATENNFTGAPVYAAAKCFLHELAAEKLKEAIRLASELGFQIRIFDAYRPTEAQQKLWDHTPDPHFLAPPERGSPHSRGVAVDLTLLDRQGKALDMGTDFDEFDVKSHHGNPDISPEATRHRLLLMGIMTTAGWDFYRNEWWHYQLFNSREFPLWSDAETGLGMM